MLSRDCHEILLIFYVIVSIVCQSTIDILLFILQAYRTFGILGHSRSLEMVPFDRS